MVITPTDSRQMTSVFLAGTIDMGNSEDWQTEVIARIDGPNIKIANPRNLIAPANSDEIDFQIRWELYHIRKSDVIFMYFAPNSKSPITLLELGLVLGMPEKKLVVVCPKQFYRHQNVKVTIQEFHRRNVLVNDTLHGGLEDLQSLIRV